MIGNESYLAGLGKSDHLILCFQFICYTQQPERIVNKLNYFKGNYLEINKELEAFDWTSVLQRLSLTASWETLADKIIQLVEVNIPVFKATLGVVKKCPYANHQYLQAIKQKHSKCTKYQHCKSDRNMKQPEIEPFRN